MDCIIVDLEVSEAEGGVLKNVMVECDVLSKEEQSPVYKYAYRAALSDVQR